jgi:hypothetical protein
MSLIDNITVRIGNTAVGRFLNVNNKTPANSTGQTTVNFYDRNGGELKTDHRFSNAVGLTWYNDNVFEEIKNQELLNKRLATLNAMKAVTDEQNKPYFATEYLVKEYLKLSDEAIEKNKSYLAQIQDTEEEEGSGKKGAEAPPPPPPVKGGGAKGTEAPATGGETKSEVSKPGAL